MIYIDHTIDEMLDIISEGYDSERCLCLECEWFGPPGDAGVDFNAMALICPNCGAEL